MAARVAGVSSAPSVLFSYDGIELEQPVIRVGMNL